MNRNSAPFKWQRYAPDVILLCVRWYCRFQLSHRDVKKVRASQCFKRFHTAERTLEGMEAVNMIRKGQVKRLAGDAARGQAAFVASLFGIAA